MKKLLLLAVLALTACAPTLGESASQAMYRANSALLLSAVIDDCKQLRPQAGNAGLRTTSSRFMTQGVEVGSGTVTCESTDTPTLFGLTLMAQQHGDVVVVTVRSTGASPGMVEALWAMLDKQFPRLPD